MFQKTRAISLKKAVQQENPKIKNFCAACFDGIYPTGDITPDLLEDIEADLNIVLPVQRFLELEAEGAIGSLAPTSYSFMGYQMNNSEWRQKYGPEVAGLMKDEAVDAVLLTPA